MRTYNDDLARHEFMAGFADVPKCDALDRWGRVLIAALFVVAQVIALITAYALGAGWWI